MWIPAPSTAAVAGLPVEGLPTRGIPARRFSPCAHVRAAWWAGPRPTVSDANLRQDLITCISNNLLSWHPSLGATEILPCLSFSRTQRKQRIELSACPSPGLRGWVEGMDSFLSTGYQGLCLSCWASPGHWTLPTLPGVTGRATYKADL